MSLDARSAARADVAAFDPFELPDTLQIADVADPYPYLAEARQRVGAAGVAVADRPRTRRCRRELRRAGVQRRARPRRGARGAPLVDRTGLVGGAAEIMEPGPRRCAHRADEPDHRAHCGGSRRRSGPSSWRRRRGFDLVAVGGRRAARRDRRSGALPTSRGASRSHSRSASSPVSSASPSVTPSGSNAGRSRSSASSCDGTGGSRRTRRCRRTSPSAPW